MDNSLNNNAIKMVSYAPIFLLMNGYWLVDNKIMFSNQWDYLMRVNDNMKSGHVFEGFKVAPSTPLLLFIMIAVAMKLLITIVPYDTLKMLGFSLGDENEISVDEDLPNFFEAIKLK